MDWYTQRCVGALIGTFVGDALGMPLEGMNADKIADEHGRVEQMLDARLGAGTYTDDTQMMLATARSLVEHDGVDREHLAETYLEHYDSSRGYGAGTTRVFNKWREGIAIDEAAGQIYKGGSFGNGGAMRIAPVGVRYHCSAEALAVAVEAVTSLTHAHPLGIGGAFVQARAVAEALRTEPPGKPVYPTTLDRGRAIQFVDRIERDLPDRWNPDGFWNERFDRVRQLLKAHDRPPRPTLVAQELGCSSETGESVPAALFSALVRMDSFEESVVYAVRVGGDTDTIAAMAGAISGALYGIGHVPDRWWDKLENGPSGRDAIIELGERLAEQARERTPS